jgi:hypothetical protein
MSDIKVGDGATYHCGSDRYPFTVIRVISGTRLVLQEDRATRVDKTGPYTESQEYTYDRDENGKLVTVSRRKNGGWYEVGQPVSVGLRYSIGHREAYQDPHF